MTKLLDQAIERARTLSDARQNEAAEILMSLAAQEAANAPRLTPEQMAEVKRRQTTKEFATDEEVSAFFNRLEA